MRPRDCAAGFTLIEVVVALAIAMLALSAMMAIVLPSRASTSLSAQFIEAARYARNHIQAVGAAGPVASARQTGIDEDGYSWSVRVTPIATRPIALVAAPSAGTSSTAPQSDAASSATPPADGTAGIASFVEVEVVESWRYGLLTHSVTLRTRKLLLIPGGTG